MRTVFFKAMVCALLLGFVSCGDKNDDSTSSAAVKVGGVKLEYLFELNSGALEIADVFFTYMDGTGKSNTEKMTSEKWSKTIEFKTFPVKAEVKASYQLKGELTKETYDFKYNVNCICKLLDSHGTATAKFRSLLDNEQELPGVKKANIETYLGRIMSRISGTWEITKTADELDVVVNK